MIDDSLEQDGNALISFHQGVISSLTLHLISVVFTNIGSDVQLSAFEAWVSSNCRISIKVFHLFLLEFLHQ